TRPMETNIFATAVALSDKDLLARIDALATTEREATAELLGHLAALELHPSLYLAQGYGSLFEYCTQALHLSAAAACNCIKPAQPSIPDDAGLPDGPSARPVATTPPDLQSTLRPMLRPVIQALGPERYRVQLTIGQETHDRLRRVQTLLRREIPSGDPAAIFD